jgi:hypothetical protein
MTDAYDDLLARAERAEAAMDNLARKLTATEAERDEARWEAIEDALAEMCEHVGRVVEPGLVTEIRNELALLAQPAEPKEEP